jgi:selenide, water dikinase
VLGDIPEQQDSRILVDFRTADDAGVYRWPGGPALVQTVDFFTPIVDDPYVYGQIAAANAVSDVYAMGGRPVTALAIAGFPQKDFDPAIIKQIFQGGFDKLREAGVVLLGGHTVRDNEIKFGYAVTGEIDPARVLSNAGARAGDVLFLTKAIGTGIIGTAIKAGRAPDAVMEAGIRSMTQLNRAAAEAVAALPDGHVHACTDITGFGLIGHTTEMANASGVTVELSASRIPLINGVRALAPGNRPGGLASNLAHFEAGVAVADEVPEDLRWLLYDPQTSGGLLFAVAGEHAATVDRALMRAGVAAVEIGRVRPREAQAIVICA